MLEGKSHPAHGFLHLGEYVCILPFSVPANLTAICFNCNAQFAVRISIRSGNHPPLTPSGNSFAMSSSSDWHQKNWRIRAPLAAGREEKPAPNPSPAHTPRVWRNVDCQSTSETWQVVTQPTWTESVDTIAQSRRIYLGNLPYRIKPNEIEDMLVAEGFGEEFESIHISVDPVTGRNPGYCFINFKTGNGAQSALESLTDTSIQGRRIKIGPCQHKRVQPAGRSDDYTPTFQRWGDWKGSRPSDPAERCPGDGRVEQGPYGALDHIDAVRKADVPARVYFGGLGKMINQVENDREIRGYLDGFNVFVPSCYPTRQNTARRIN